jgi:hypothetical protein
MKPRIHATGAEAATVTYGSSDTAGTDETSIRLADARPPLLPGPPACRPARPPAARPGPPAALPGPAHARTALTAVLGPTIVT